jgi:serpin B
MRYPNTLAVVLLAACASGSLRSMPAPAVRPVPAPEAPPTPASAAATPTQARGEAAAAATVAPVEPRPRAARAITDFALRIARQTDEFDRHNFVLSPVSIVLALGMTQAGARGSTERQMAETMGLQDPDHAWVSSAFGALSARMRADRHVLDGANRIYLQTGYELVPAFERLLQTRYAAPLELLDFARDPEASRKRINAWVARNTHDKIEELLRTGTIDRGTEAVLVNALYLAATWQDGFDPEQTRPGAFRTLDGGSVNVPMMRRKGAFLAARGDYGTIVKLPYAGGALAMVVLMPETPAQLPALVARLSADELDRALSELTPAPGAELLVPRFTLETASHSLKCALFALGMRDPFNDADLTGISPRLRGSAITDVIHGARIEVDERGTVAAASTAVIIGKSAAAGRVAIDAPFWLFVRDEQTGLVLFTGQVVDPTAGLGPSGSPACAASSEALPSGKKFRSR